MKIPPLPKKEKGKPRGRAPKGVVPPQFVGKNFQKGNKVQPTKAQREAGRNRNTVEKQLRKMASDEVREVLTLLLELDPKGLRKLSRVQSGEKAILVWFARVMEDGIKNKSLGPLDKILDRCIGPITMKTELTGKDGAPLNPATDGLSLEERRKQLEQLRKEREHLGDD